MATLDEIRALGNDFITNIQKLQTSNAIGQASDEAAKITQQVTDEGERRQALTQTGNALALRLGQLGAPVSQIESAFKAITPKAPGSMAEAILMGDNKAVGAYQKSLDAQTKASADADAPKLRSQEKISRENNISQEKIAGANNQARLDEENRKNRLATMPKPLAERVAKLPGEAQNRLGFISDAYAALQEMKAALKKGDRTFTGWGDNDFTYAQKLFVENLGRTNSGGVVGVEERAAMKDFTPSKMNSKERQQTMLMRLDGMLERKVKAFGLTKPDLEELSGKTSPTTGTGNQTLGPSQTTSNKNPLDVANFLIK